MMVSALIEREFERAPLPVRSGVLVAVVGPSGAGKDTLIAGARAAFAPHDDVLFVRRTVTRRRDAGAEDHVSVSAEDFHRAEATGAFALTWPAHGLRYGIPATVDHHLASGHVAVVNGSRRALAAMRARYTNCLVVNVVATREILAERLAARGRESPSEILARLDRAAAAQVDADAEIDNSGVLSQGVDRLVEVIRTALVRAQVCDIL